ncbi:hypothetical protein B0A50_04500 [Salinomyces thailandicus]|uniref:Uncharacterized protein n=1 Tax=Salinomyces thailandicus TaxID=706561 RepID=A0A4U0TXH5_9PEZI|nr:hypothetical protein B0A50_04500 [Salinomyces thailandica]
MSEAPPSLSGMQGVDDDGDVQMLDTENDDEEMPVAEEDDGAMSGVEDDDHYFAFHTPFPGASDRAGHISHFDLAESEQLAGGPEPVEGVAPSAVDTVRISELVLEDHDRTALSTVRSFPALVAPEHVGKVGAVLPPARSFLAIAGPGLDDQTNTLVLDILRESVRHTLEPGDLSNHLATTAVINMLTDEKDYVACIKPHVLHGHCEAEEGEDLEGYCATHTIFTLALKDDWMSALVPEKVAMEAHLNAAVDQLLNKSRDESGRSESSEANDSFSIDAYGDMGTLCDASNSLYVNLTFWPDGSRPVQHRHLQCIDLDDPACVLAFRDAWKIMYYTEKLCNSFNTYFADVGRSEVEEAHDALVGLHNLLKEMVKFAALVQYDGWREFRRNPDRRRRPDQGEGAGQEEDSDQEVVATDGEEAADKEPTPGQEETAEEERPSDQDEAADPELPSD